MAPPPVAAAEQVPVDMDWDDEDEKTTVFDRSSEDSARALLHSSPAPAAGAPAPPPPVSAAPVPSAVKTNPTASARALAPPGLANLSSRPPMPPAVSRPPEPPVSRAAVPPPAFASSAPIPSSAPATAVATPAPSGPPPATLAPPSLNKNKLVLGGAAVAAAAIAAFALVGGSKTGRLVVTVAGPGGKALDDVEVLIDGKAACTDSPCIIEELPAGHRVLQVKAPGYETKAGRAITIESGKEHAENVELVPESSGAGLKVAAEGSGLELYLNGKYVGPLPQELKDLEPGKHTVKISGSSTYAPYEQEITVEANKTIELEPKLELVKGTVTIQLGDNAKGADIFFVDGANKKQINKKTFPLTIEVPADKSYKVVAQRSGYEDFEQDVSFSDGKAEQTITIDLSADSSSGGSPAPSRRTPAARTPASSPAPQAAPGPVQAAAPSGQGTLNINSIPVSNVILNGRPLGPTPKVGVSVPAGSHTVVFVHPEHGRKVRAVTVQAGQTTTAAVRFP